MRIDSVLKRAMGGMAIMAMTAAADGITAIQDGAGMDLKLGGAGGVYFLAEPGELQVQVFKQDRNRGRVLTHLRAILFGPDRQVLQEEWLKDDGVRKGKPGEPQMVLLTAKVPAKGIYGLNITVSEDRYGGEAWWSFRTNCEKFMVETSRGHRDRRHEEPLQFSSPEIEGDVCFQPDPNGFAVEVNGLPAGGGPLLLIDGAGKTVATLPAGKDGKASTKVAKDRQRSIAPWRLHFPKLRGTVQIDGVTRWRKADLSPELSLWTPTPSSWFPFHANRWPLTPYSRTMYGATGDSRELPFLIQNRSLKDREFALALEYPGTKFPVELSKSQVKVKARSSATVTARVTMPKAGDALACRLRVTPQDGTGFTTYSSIMLKRGKAPAETDPLPIPLDLKPYRHENEQFGYLPEYPLDNQMYFDLKNRPFVAAPGALWSVQDGKWRATPLASVANRPKGAGVALRCTKVAFDADNTAYVVATMDRKPALLYSDDGGKTLTAAPIPGGGTFDIEQFSGHNTPSGPPPFIRITRTAKDPKLHWRSLCDLDLFLPRKENGKVVVGDPIRISKLCIGLSNHSGMPSSIVSRGDKVHVAWAEATDPKEKVPGVPTYVVTYDRTTGKLGEPHLVGYGPPANDVHNTPCITIDSKGILHVLIGTHGRAFRYSRSRLANDASGGWSPATEVGRGLSQTYVGLVCDQDDTLHLVFRLWMRDGKRFPAGHFATLSRMSKLAGEPWSKSTPLVLAPFSEYSIFYHRLTIDRKGRPFLSYDYWSTFHFYRRDHQGGRRALMFSPDAAKTWKLAGAGDLAE
jgi:hypothetical protein